MFVRSRKLKIWNLPKNDTYISCINSKPYSILFTILIVAIALLIVYHRFLISMLLLSFSTYHLVFVKNKRIVEFYKDYSIFYEINHQKDDCILVFWKDIKSWKFHANKKNEESLCITLADNTVLEIQCVHRQKVEHYFRKFIVL